MRSARSLNENIKIEGVIDATAIYGTILFVFVPCSF